jgi:hypothetical protein
MPEPLELEVWPPELPELEEAWPPELEPEVVPPIALAHCDEQLLSTHCSTASAAVVQSDDCCCTHVVMQLSKLLQGQASMQLE